MDTPVRTDSFRFELRIFLEEVIQRRIGIRNVVDTDRSLTISLGAVRLENRQIGKRKSVVFVIIGQKSQRWFWYWTSASKTVLYQLNICSKRRLR